MKFKKGVKIFGCCPQILATMPIADEIWRSLGAEAVVTSGSEQTSRHSRASIHYSGGALDYRIRNIQNPNIAADMLRDSLTDEYDVVLERTHIHLEFQPKRILS